MARGLNPSPISAIHPALGQDAAGGSSDRLVISHITPQHHLATVADVGGAGVNVAFGAEVHGRRLVQAAAALPAAAHPNRAATCRTFGLYAGAAVQGQIVAFQLDASAQAAAAVGAQHRLADDQLGRCGLFRRRGPTGLALGLQVNPSSAVDAGSIEHRIRGLNLLVGRQFNHAAGGWCHRNFLLSIYRGVSSFQGNRQHLTAHLGGFAGLYRDAPCRTAHRRHVQHTGAGLGELRGLDLDLRHKGSHLLNDDGACSRSNH